MITKIVNNLPKKIEHWKTITKRQRGLMLKKDPSIFAFLYLRNPLNPNKPLKVYPWQDMFLNDKSRFRHLTKSRQIGGSICLCIEILHKITYANKDKTILVFSKGEKQAQDINYKLKLLMKNSKLDYRKSLKIDSKSELYRQNANGTECRVLSEVATDSALGHSPSDVYLDEFSYVESAQEFYERIVSPMVLKTRGNITVISTPTHDNSYHHKLYQSPSYVHYHFDWKACPTHTKEDMLKAKDEMDLIPFRSEWLAEYVSGKQAQYYPYKIIKPCISDSIDQTIDKNKTYYAGVDWGKMQSSNVITVISHIRNGLINDVEVVEIIAKKQVPYSSIIGEIKYLNEKYNLARIYCDRGAGEGQIDMLKEQLGINVEGVAFTIQSKVDMNANLKKLFEKKEIKIPNNKQLINELIGFEYSFTSTGKMKLHGEPDDFVDSLALSIMGVTTHKPSSLTIIKKTPLFDKKLNPVQQDLQLNKSKKKFKLPCDKCIQEGLVNIYFDADEQKYKQGIKQFCPLHS